MDVIKMVGRCNLQEADASMQVSSKSQFIIDFLHLGHFRTVSRWEEAFFWIFENLILFYF